MGEIRLICPSCATVYQVPEAAIPAGGRDVECSECGLSWRASNPAFAETAPDPLPSPPAPAPERAAANAEPAPPDPKAVPLEQRLAPNVLNILREAVETERRARHGTDQAPLEAVPDIDWPATTITGDDRQEPPPPSRRPTTEIPPQALPELPAQAASAPEPIDLRSPSPAAVPTPVAAPRRATGYLIGMGLSAMMAAALVSVYVMAPRMADAGELGATLMDLRHQIEGARVWLNDLIR